MPKYNSAYNSYNIIIQEYYTYSGFPLIRN